MPLPISEIVMLLVGVGLIFIAPKVVGMIMRVIGIALILAGASIYLFPERLITYVDPTSVWILLIAGIPVIAGIGLVVVGAGMAKLAVRIAGILLVISALAGLGVIAL